MSNTNEKPRYVLQWDSQPQHLCKILCSLLETETLVDLTILCNSHLIKVHKCILAAHSSYFRERLQSDMSIDRIVINNIPFVVLKSLIEFVYCGETSLSEEYLEELIAAANYFNIQGITSIIPEKLGFAAGDEKCFNLAFKPPLFFSRKDKIRYYKKDNELFCFRENVKVFDDNNNNNNSNNTCSTFVQVENDVNMYDDEDEAHVALAKEEAASRNALEMLRKELAFTSNVLEVEDSCTEALVETNLTTHYTQANGEENENKNEFELKQSPQDVDHVEEVEFDGTFLVDNNAVSFQVDTNPVELQYICNDLSDFNMVENPVCYQILKPDDSSKENLAYSDLVADAVNPNYVMNENQTESVPDGLIQNETELAQDYAEQNRIDNDVTIYETIITTNNKELDYQINNEMPKRRRGRPPKQKTLDMVDDHNRQDIRYKKFRKVKKNEDKENWNENLENSEFLSEYSLNKYRRQTRSSTKLSLSKK